MLDVSFHVCGHNETFYDVYKLFSWCKYFSFPQMLCAEAFIPY